MPADDSLATSVSLIDRARRLEPEAWRRLCAVYGPLVYRWARVAGLQESDAADVGQEVFRTVAARIEAFDHSGPGATFRGWLRVITRNKIGDAIRKLQGHPAGRGGTTAIQRLHEVPEELPESLSDEPRFDADRALLYRALEAIRAEFEPNTWRAFWQSVVDEQPSDRIAEDLGISRQAVRQAKYRVLQRLRRELGAESAGALA